MARMQTAQGRAGSELLEELQGLREEARLKLHLASMSAKQEWHELERHMHELEEQLLGKEVSEVTRRSATEIGSAMRRFLQHHAQKERRVSDLMAHPAAACAPFDRLEDAARIMWENDCGIVPVVEPEGMLVGVITDRDVCMAAYTQGVALKQSFVASAMSKEVRSCDADAPLHEAARIMREEQVRRLPVIDAGGRVVGVLSLADLVRSGDVDDDEIATTLASICRPHADRAVH